MSLRQSITRFLMLATVVCLAACQQEAPSYTAWSHDDDGVFNARFSPDGQYLLTAAREQGASLWQVSTREPFYQWQSDENSAVVEQALAFSPDGRFAATSERRTVIIWRVSDGRPVQRLTLPQNIKAMALSPSASHILMVMADGKAVYFDVNDRRSVYRFRHDGSQVNSPVDHQINAVDISHGDRYALTGGDDHTARLWDLQTGETVHQFTHDNLVNLVRFDPNQQFIVTAADNGQTYVHDMSAWDRLYRLESGLWPADSELPSLPVFALTTTAVAFSGDRQLLATAHPNEKICLWQLKTGNQQRCWKVPRLDPLRPGVVVHALAFSPDSHQLISAATNGQTHHWELK